MPEGIDKILNVITWVNIDTVFEYEKNPKIHTTDQIEKLAYTFKKFGFDVPIVVDKDNVIIKGHARMAAAKKLKWKKVPIIVRGNLTPQQVKAARIADNQVAESYWDMPALIEELEALYGLDDPNLPVTDTGFSEMEIRSFLPGMMETEEVDYKIPHGTEGILVGFMNRRQQDGKIGSPDPYINKKDDESVLFEFDITVIPTNGGAMSIATALKVREIDSSKRMIFIYSNPGTPQFEDTIPYLEHAAKMLDAEFINASPPDDTEFRGRISTQGYPSLENLWCEIGIVLPSIENWLRKEGLATSKTVMVLGATSDQAEHFRRIGKFERSYTYFNPFIEFKDGDLYAFLEKNLSDVLGLHPMYRHFTSISCCCCPQYKSPDFAYMKNNMLKTWLTNLEYFGYSKRNRSYRYSENFDRVLKDMIAESIDPRALLPFAEFAMESFKQ